MKKQTVQQRYNEQQIMKQYQKNITAQQPPQGQQQLQTVFKQTSQALQQAHQAVRQAQAGNPVQLQLQYADQRLTHATQQLQQLQTSAPEIALGLTTSMQTQLKELDHYIQQAGKTLQLLQTSMASS